MKHITAFLFAILLCACMPPAEPTVEGTPTETFTPAPTDTPIHVVLRPKWTQTASRTPTEITPSLTNTPTRTSTETRTSTLIPSLTRTKVPNPAPDFTVATVTGEPFTLSDQFGSPVVLFFVAAYCPHCHKMMPVMQSIHQKDPSLKIALIDATDNAAKTLAFANSYGISFFIIQDKDGAISKRYNVNGIPNLVFINSVGSIVDRFAGETATEHVMACIAKAKK
jgi:peroxiredoxin